MSNAVKFLGQRDTPGAPGLRTMSTWSSSVLCLASVSACGAGLPCDNPLHGTLDHATLGVGAKTYPRPRYLGVRDSSGGLSSSPGRATFGSQGREPLVSRCLTPEALKGRHSVPGGWPLRSLRH